MIRRLLLDNFGWKALSLAIALALWVGFVASPQLVTSVSVPVGYRNMPPDLEMSLDTPERVLLELHGPSAKIQGFDAAHASVVLNLGSVHGPGQQTFAIGPENVRLPAGVTVERTIPSQLRIGFEAREKAAVSVRIRWAAPPPAGYRIRNQVVSPPTVTITGPASRIRQVAYAETDPIDLSHVVGKSEFHVHTFVADPQVRYLSSPVVAVIVTLERAAPAGTASPSEGTARN
jgi:hypothetical protein